MSTPTIKKRVCDRCGEEFFETYKEWLCKDCMNELGWEYTPKTNADHICSMTDEELADLLHDYYCEGHADGLFHIYDAMPISDVRDWLKQPYGGDT